MKKLESIDTQIEKLESFLENREHKEILFSNYMDEAINIVPYELPALLYPAQMGRDLYEDCIDYNSDSLVKQIVACAIATPIAIPLMTLSFTLSAPFVVSAIPTSAILGGIQAAQASAYNARTEKAQSKLESLKKEREKLSKESKR